MNKSSHRLLLSNIRQLITVSSTFHKFIPLQATHQIEPLSQYSVAIDHQGTIAKVAPH
jgi:hypothetical protein